MAETHRSQDWYRIAEARPRLRREVRVVLHTYLGQPWYVLADATGTKVHRVTPAAYELVGRLDGTRDVAAIWEDLQTRLAEDAPTQDEVVSLLSQLHQSDLLDASETPMLPDLLERRDKDRLQKWKKLLLNPLSATVPLVDPDRFLSALARVMGVIPRPVYWLAALALIVAALARLPLHWPALTQRGLSGFLDLENLALIALIYPVVKAIHEIGHGIAVRARGGEVHEMGLMFIAFYPIPYVEASAALTFPSKWDRAAVAAAGVVVELCIAAIAFFLWTQVADGTLRAILFNTMVISGLSTLVINGNPLLKFDGYHAMCDVIEIPNLSKRGNEYWGEITRVYLLGTDERARARMRISGWERLWFFVYPPAAFAYRIFISFTIALFVATTYRLLGVLLAIWSVSLMLIWPILKTAHKGLTDARIRRSGGRAVAGAAGTAAALLVLLFAVPLPHHAAVQGVVWLPEEAILRAPEAGRIDAQHAEHGAALGPGDPLVTIRAPELAAQADIRAARLTGAEARYAAARLQSRAEAARAAEAVTEARAALDDAAGRLRDLQMTAPVSGTLDLPRAADLAGRFVQRGEVIGHILPDAPPVVRAALPQDLAALVDTEARGVALRLAAAPGAVLTSEILRQVPAGGNALPSPVLALDGGGPFATRPPAQGADLQSVRQLFQLDLALPEGARPAYGMRAHVRLTFAPKSAGIRAARALRALFLDAFDV